MDFSNLQNFGKETKTGFEIGTDCCYPKTGFEIGTENETEGQGKTTAESANGAETETESQGTTTAEAETGTGTETEDQGTATAEAETGTAGIPKARRP
jgi:hypothetical protein